MSRVAWRSALLAGLLFAGSSSNSLLVQAGRAQTNSVSNASPVLTYQALITNTGDAVKDGVYPVTVTLYEDENGTRSVWQDSYKAQVTSGVVSLALGSSSPLPEPGKMERAHFIGIKFNGADEMRPLNRISASPYALNVADNSITEAKMATDYVGAISVNGERVTAKGGVLNITSGNGLTASFDKETSSLKLEPATPQVPIGPNHWGETGNTGTIPGPNFVGTVDNAGLELHIYDASPSPTDGVRRVFGYYPNATSANLIGGHNTNVVGAGVVGATISGGGQNGSPNQVLSDFGVVAGGRNNTAGGGGGITQTVGGGDGNTASEDGATIAGGEGNIAATMHSAIGGGFYNLTRAAGGAPGSGVSENIPGGDHLIAQSYCQTVMGFYNTPKGSLVGNPGAPPPPPIIAADDDPIVIVGNGLTPTFTSNAFEVSYNGHATPFQVLGNNGAGPVAPVKGAYYNDNAINAWGVVNSAGTATNDFGVSGVAFVAPNTYTITINYPAGTITNASITATVSDDGCLGGGAPGFCMASELGACGAVGSNQFVIHTFSAGGAPMALPFMFKLAGR